MEEQKDCYLTRGEEKGVNSFPNRIWLKVNIILWLELEFAYNDIAVKHTRDSYRIMFINLWYIIRLLDAI